MDDPAVVSPKTDASPPWPSAPAQPSLGDKDVHVWRASLQQPLEVVERLCEVLSTNEQTRAASFHFAKDRQHYILARGILRRLLGGYLETAPADIHFTYGDQGKPFLTVDHFGERAPLKFNLAHSGGLAVYGFTLIGEIGVDLEQVNPEFCGEDIARRFFSANEVACLEALPAAERTLAFFNCWTRKEAFIKAKGIGLSLALDQFDVTLTPEQQARLLRTCWDESEADRWSLRTLEIGAGYVGALAIEAHDWQLSCWQVGD